MTSRTDRRYYNLSICPIAGCQSSFESTEELDAHIASNIHSIVEDDHRSSNDIARIHLIEAVRATTISTQHQTAKVFQQQLDENTSLDRSPNYKYFSHAGWALRQRKHTNPLTKKIRDFIETKWLESQEHKSKLSPETIHHEIRTLRTNTGSKIFQPEEYPTLNQVKYQCRKLAKKYDIHTKQKLIEELTQGQIDRKI